MFTNATIEVFYSIMILILHEIRKMWQAQENIESVEQCQFGRQICDILF